MCVNLANEFVPGSRRAAPGSFQDLVVSESGIELEHHLEVRVEATGCHHDSLAADGDRLASLGITTFQTGDAAALEPQRRNLRLGNDLAALLTEAFDEVSHQAQTVALGPGPAPHGVAFLGFEVDPLHAEAFGPVVEIVERVLDVVAGPDRVGRRTSPFDPVLEGQVGCVMDAVLQLQWRSDDQTATSGYDGRTAGFGALLEGDGARSRIASLDAGRHTGAACTNDRDVGLVLLDTCHWSPRRTDRRRSDFKRTH
jgi:hypothetical protein